MAIGTHERSEMAADKYFHIIVRIMITTLQSHQEAVFTD